MANEVATINTVQKHLAQNITALKSILPAHITPEKMSRLALNQLRINPKLTLCKIESFMGAIMQSSALGLEIDSRGYAFLIPYGTECQFQTGYKGLMQLFYNSSLSKMITAKEIREKDIFEFDYCSGVKPVHKFSLTEDRGKVIAYYCLAELTTGTFNFEILTVKEAEEHRKKFSKAKYNSPWETNFDAMALKTVIIKCLKFMPKSTELERLESAMYADQKIVKGYNFNQETQELDINTEFMQPDSPEPEIIQNEDKQKISEILNNKNPVKDLAAKLVKDKVNPDEFYKANGLTTENTDDIIKILSDDNYYLTCLQNMKPANPAEKINYIEAIKKKLLPHNIDIDSYFEKNSLDILDELIQKKIATDDGLFKQYLAKALK